jgi:hypothetical protein
MDRAQLGRPFKYNWDAWDDGEEHEAVYGVDFDCAPSSFGAAVRHTAKRRRRRAIVSVDEDEQKVYFALIPHQRTA